MQPPPLPPIPSSTPASGPVIVLGCAKSRRADLATVIEVLAGRGHAVELVSGLEVSAQRWIEAGQRLGNRGHYLLCGSLDLPAPALGGLVQLLAQQGVSPARIWAQVIDWNQPAIVLREAAARLAASGASIVGLPTQAPDLTARAPGRPTPSGNVPILSASANASDELVVPIGPVRRFLGSPTGMVTAIGGSLALVTALAVGIAWTSDDATETEEDKTAVRGEVEVVPVEPEPEPETAPAAVEATPTPTPPADADAEEPEVAGTVPAVPAAEAPAPAAPAEAEAKPADAGSKAAAATPSTSSPPPPSADNPVEFEVAEVGPPSDEEGRILAALQSRKIRALDILLVSPVARKKTRRRHRVAKMTFADAEAYCHDLDVDGVGAWRLPVVGELDSLSEGNVLEKGLYWSMTKGNAFGTERLLWNTKKERMGPAPVRWRGGNVLCVRHYRPDDAESVED